MQQKIIFKTPRLYVREICPDDFAAIAKILQNIEVMYAWEHAFTDEEVTAWIEENIMRYERDGYSYWAVLEKSSNKLTGVCGILAETAENSDYTGIGYIFDKDFWQQGFAFECAQACKEYAFSKMKVSLLTAQIRPGNNASRKLAEKLGMSIHKSFTRFYRGKEMPHLLYSCSK